MRALSLYALATAVFVALVVAVAFGVDPVVGRAVGWMGALAWALQVALFLPIIAARGRRNAFFAAWGGGTLVRFAAVGLAAWLISSTKVLPIAPSLLALAAFLFVLLALEPVFFRIGLRSK